MEIREFPIMKIPKSQCLRVSSPSSTARMLLWDKFGADIVAKLEKFKDKLSWCRNREDEEGGGKQTPIATLTNGLTKKYCPLLYRN